MSRFQDLQSTYAELKKADEEHWADLYSAAKILTGEFARYIQVPQKTPFDGSDVPNWLYFGKVVDNEFVGCDTSQIEKGVEQIEFALALMLDQKPSESPPNRLVVRLTLGRDQFGYTVGVGHRRNSVKVIDGDFSQLNEAIYKYLNGVLIPPVDIS
jgi:hypothetical protein